MSAGYYKDKSENVKVSLLISNLTPSVLNLPRSRITGLPFLSVNIRDLSPVMRKGEISKSLNTPYSIVKHIIRADILRVAWYFSEPLRGEEKYEQWAKCPLVLYATRSNKRFLFPVQKIVNLQLASIFLVRVFRNILIPSVRMMLTMSKIFGRIICQTIKWEVNYFIGSRGDVFVVRTSKPVETVALQFRDTFSIPQTKRLRARKIGFQYTIPFLLSTSGDVLSVSEAMVCGYWFSKWRTTKSSDKKRRNRLQ